MKLQHQVTIQAPVGDLWAFIMDVPRVAGCLPGVTGVEAVDAAAGHYRGKLTAAVGPFKLSATGVLHIEAQDPAAHTATLRADANAGRFGGAARASLHLSLTPAGNTTTLRIDTDAEFQGRLGGVIEPLLRKKTDAVLTAFAHKVQSRIEADRRRDRKAQKADPAPAEARP